MAHLLLVSTLLSTICGVLTEVHLIAGEEVTVTFTGPQLHIEVINHRTHGEYFVICFKSHPNNNARRCPIGYASLYYLTTRAARRYTYHITRQGQLSDTRYTEVLGKVVFGEGGSITLLAYQLPSQCTLRLVNAQKVVPTTTTTSTTEKITTTTVVIKETSNRTVYFVIGGLALLLILYIFLNEEVTVTFSGLELIVNMENPRLTDMLQFVLCLKSYPTTVQKYCPNGYASFYYWFVGQDRIRYRMTRYGTIVDGTASVIRGSVLFDYDGSVTIKVVKLPPGSYVHLINAEKVIPTTTAILADLPSTMTTTEVVQKASYIIYYVIGGLALLTVIIVGALVAFICWSRKSKTTNDVEGKSKANAVRTAKSAKPNPPPTPRKVPTATDTFHLKMSSTQQHFENHPSYGSDQSEH